MYQRDECLVQASICREKAQADPARSDYWIDRAIVWLLRRAIQAGRGKAVHDGRTITRALKYKGPQVSPGATRQRDCSR
jgi:hypothetical protein